VSVQAGDEAVRPLPVPDELTQGYWAGAARHQLTIQRCASCSTYIHPPRAACRRCQSLDLVPTVVSGKGAVYSYTVTYTPFVPYFEPRGPYALVLTELAEQPGLRILTTIQRCAQEEVRIGMAVRFEFEDVAEGVALPYVVPDEPGEPARG
jgi:uncharacterized OB-fold protein